MTCEIEKCQTIIPGCKCAQCISKFIPSLDKTACIQETFCKECAQAGRTCDQTGQKKCIFCEFKPSADGISCIDNTICQTCSRTQICVLNQSKFQCQECGSSQLASFDQQQCISAYSCGSCPVNTNCVIKVNGSTTCKKCDNGMPSTDDRFYCYQKAPCDNCMKQGKICDFNSECVDCLPGQVPNELGTKCIVAEDCRNIFGCHQCNDNKTCDVCISGMEVKDGTCVAASSCQSKTNCAICDDRYTSDCKACNKGFKVSSGRCYEAKCQDGQECQSQIIGSTGCTLVNQIFQCTCPYSFQLSSNSKNCLDTKICYNCQTQNQLCIENESQSALVCGDCPSGTKYNQSKCIPSECDKCKENQICISKYPYDKFECQDCVSPKIPNETKSQCIENKCLTDCADIHSDFVCIEGKSDFICDCPKGTKFSKNASKCLPDGCTQCSYGDACLETAENFTCVCQKPHFVYTPEGCQPDCEGGSYCTFRGECDANNKCVCRGNYSGDNCQSCVTGMELQNQVCISTSCTTENHCFGNGECKVGVCECFPGFSGKNCEVCPPGAIFNGITCVSESCGRLLQCGGRGKCGDDGVCKCNELYTGWNCLQCVDGVQQNFHGECFNGGGEVVKSGLTALEGVGIALGVVCLVLAGVAVFIGVKLMKSRNFRR